MKTLTSTQPAFGGNGAKLLERAANINSWQQRAIIGATAVTIQPLIELSNKDVDEKTRKTSANRRIAIALVGTLSGIAVRGGCMKVAEHALKKDKWVKKLANIVSKDNTEAAIKEAERNIKNGGAKKYASVIGTLGALFVLIFSNFAVDMPLTNWVTDKLNAKYEKKPEKEPENGV